MPRGTGPITGRQNETDGFNVKPAMKAFLRARLAALART
jgi:hypothetical protein